MLDFSILLVNTNRSKAYLQNLIKRGFLPKSAIVLQDNNYVLPEQKGIDSIYKDTKQTLERKVKSIDISFDEKEHVITTLKNNNIEYCIANTLDVNSEEVINYVRECPSNYIIYSGPGGAILKKEILEQDKKFIHVHPGWLPDFKGSTTIYYSMLIENSIACSVILLDENIDSGPILYRKRFEVPKDIQIDFDVVLDPIVRASTLIDFMQNQTDEMMLREESFNNEGNVFYIVHPVLKHMAILSQRAKEKKGNIKYGKGKEL
ncbi:methionyl-tRNA formyltransferase-like protein [Proteiniborus sp. DW1]|uniref:formyltransferase family protein n=1 Tax=Proteiniborus sp. DW1 TaxID=1889883 RepID=UPI00092E0E53|nr:formyltransferase family protein [Proteiniborus sp. DW1]SCG81931.1 methionyl-tRNA formyltransferase-like protein [Proteiniborus sp. DW1]